MADTVIIPKADYVALLDAIREKGGTSALMTTPQATAAVEAIETGITPTGTKQISITENGTTTEDVAAYANAEITVDVQGGGANEDLIAWADGSITIVDLTGATSVQEGRMGYAKSGSSFTVFAPDVLGVGQYAFRQSTKLTSISLPKATYIGNYAFEACALTSINFPALSNNGDHTFYNCSSLITAVFSGFTGILRNTTFMNCTALKAVDLYSPTDLYGECFRGATVFDTLIIRKTNGVTALNNISSFTGTPFASGGSGGTIYIPKALYDHLGDNSALDYKAATNWATVNGYGTITWAQIEGSQYENYYADGTPVSTT